MERKRRKTMKQDIMQEFFDQAVGYMTRIKEEERERIQTAATQN